MARSIRRILIPLAALLLLVAACGDDDEGAAPTTQAESPNTEPFVSTTAVATTAATTTTEPAVPADPNRTVAAGDAISVHYVGTLDDGEQFDSSRDRGQPLSFVVGSGQLISGFDEAVLGMKVGEVKTVRLEPEEAYGQRVENQTVTAPLDQLPADVAVGQVLYSSSGQEFTVLEVGETEASLEYDPNHPLAGEALTFEIEVVSFDS